MWNITLFRELSQDKLPKLKAKQPKKVKELKRDTMEYRQVHGLSATEGQHSGRVKAGSKLSPSPPQNMEARGYRESFQRKVKVLGKRKCSEAFVLSSLITTYTTG